MTRALGMARDILRITSSLLLLLLLPASVAAQTVTTTAIDRMGDLTVKVTQTGLPPGAVVPYNLNVLEEVAFQCVRKGQVVPLDIMLDSEWVEEWTAVAKPTGTVRTARTVFLLGGSPGLCTTGWSAEVTWVRYRNLFLFDETGVLVTLASVERRLK